MDKLAPIQMLWIGPRLRYLERVCIESFLAVGHPVCFYTYGFVDNVPDGVYHMNANLVIPEEKIFRYPSGPGKGSVAAFANLFRYKLLLEKGGWWSDADVYCLKPWDFDEDFVFVREPASLKLIHNGIIRAPVGHPFMRGLYNIAKTQDPGTLRWGQTGSKLLTDLLSHAPDMQRYIVDADTFCPIFWGHIPKSVKKPPRTLTEKAYGMHLFQEMWRRRNINNDTNQPIFDWLKQQRTNNA